MSSLVAGFPPEWSSWLAAHGWLLGLVAARVCGLAWAAPAFSAPGVDARIRLASALVLVPIVAPAVLAEGGSRPWDSIPAWALGAACLVEALIGVGLGLAAGLIIAGARQAGEVVGLQAGFAPAALFDPEAGDEMTALGHLYGLVALGVFLALDGPLMLVKGLVESHQILPPGVGVAPASAVSFAFGRVGEALALAVRAAAPAALALVLAGAALGLIGRASPTIQRAALSLPLRSVLGLVLVGLALTTMVATFVTAWHYLFIFPIQG